MHKCIWLVVVSILMLFFATGVYAGNIADSNNGTVGQVLVNNGQDQGGTDVGTWTDALFLKGDKGDKGETGATGSKGATGAQGIQGFQGIQGEQGIQGVKGDKGTKGDKGNKGDTGADGKDVDPTTVTNLQNSITTEMTNRVLADGILQTNINNETVRAVGQGDILKNNLDAESHNRIDGDNALQSNIDDVDTNSINRDTTLNDNITAVNDHVDNLDNRVGKLEKTQYKLEYGVRILDTQHMAVVPYISQNFTRSCVDEVGIRVTFKIGKSYEEKLIEKHDARQRELQEQIYTMKADFAAYKAEQKYNKGA